FSSRAEALAEATSCLPASCRAQRGASPTEDGQRASGQPLLRCPGLVERDRHASTITTSNCAVARVLNAATRASPDLRWLSLPAQIAPQVRKTCSRAD